MGLAEAIATGDVLGVARHYVAAGLSVIPVRADGSKAPALGKGEVEQYRERFPLDQELQRWFAPGRPVGVAVVCGVVSGNLAVLDFETPDAWAGWLSRVGKTPLAAVLATAPQVRTPRGGRHVYCRITQGWVAGGKLAQRPDGKTVIEIRGQGHYVLAPGCPVACHEANRPYTFESEGWLAHAA